MVEAAVLAAISRGVKTVRALAKLFNTSEDAIASIVERLKSMGLVEEVEKGLIIRRRELRLTREGLERLDEALRLLRNAASRVEAVAREQGRVTREALPEELGFVLPLLAVLGLINLNWLLGYLALEELEALEDIEAGDYEEGMVDYDLPEDGL